MTPEELQEEVARVIKDHEQGYNLTAGDIEILLEAIDELKKQLEELKKR